MMVYETSFKQFGAKDAQCASQAVDPHGDTEVKTSGSAISVGIFHLYRAGS